MGSVTLSEPSDHCARTNVPGILMTGTGRAGTSFLMAVLSDLSLPTGFSSADADHALSTSFHAGLEWSRLPACIGKNSTRINWNTGISIFKKPQLTFKSERAFWLTDPQVSHVIVPVRKLAEAASSRASNGHGNGGFSLDSINSIDDEASLEAQLLAGLLIDLAAYDIPFTLLPFPLHVLDSTFCAAKLSWLLQRYNISTSRFILAHHSRKNLSLVHRRAEFLPPSPPAMPWPPISPPSKLLPPSSPAEPWSPISPPSNLTPSMVLHNISAASFPNTTAAGATFSRQSVCRHTPALGLLRAALEAHHNSSAMPLCFASMSWLHLLLVALGLITLGAMLGVCCTCCCSDLTTVPLRSRKHRIAGGHQFQFVMNS
mmetsp:Transcript_72379/g.120637  ORF Transcript_72379/g.120637 Transcript_72379/m.120637 type:complete len:373 (+) Transcript_72379:167-1285(+)